MTPHDSFGWAILTGMLHFIAVWHWLDRVAPRRKGR